MPKIKTAPRVISASMIKGTMVSNLEGQDVGKIEELMIDWLEGRIAYAVLSFGGILGFGNKLFAVPWDILTLDIESQGFIMKVNKELLESAPGFDKDNWPDTSDERWIDEIYRHYGSLQYWEA